MRIRLDIAYDGTHFRGWARQPGLRSVQGTLEDALGRVLGGTPRLTVAGRTDAGVHAAGQVAHVDLPEEVWREHHEKLLKRLAGRLPKDVRVWALRPAPSGFDARFSAIWRRYAYRVTDNPGGVDPLLRGHVLWHDRPLDVDAMNEAARHLLGEHDFAAYCKKREGATTIRTLRELSLVRGEDGIITATVRADAFCHNLVRNLVGACVAVGEGAMPEHRAVGVRREAARNGEFRVVPATGLTMVEVGYPPDDEVAARVVLTQVKRSAASLDG